MKKPKNVEAFISLLETKYGLKEYPKPWNGVELYTVNGNDFGLILYKYDRHWRFSFVFCLDKVGLGEQWTYFPGFYCQEALNTKPIPISRDSINIVGATHTVQKMTESYTLEVLRLFATLRNDNQNLLLAKKILKVVETGIIDKDYLLN